MNKLKLAGISGPILGDTIPTCCIAFADYILIAAGVAVSLRSWPNQ